MALPFNNLSPLQIDRGLAPTKEFDFTKATLPQGVVLTRTTVATSGLWTDAPGSSYTSYAIDEARVGQADGMGLLIEGTRVNRFRNSAAPANHTTPSIPTGTYTVWMIGTGTLTVAANTAVGTGFGSVTAGSLLTVVISTAGTVDVTITGSVDRIQWENGSDPTSFIVTGASGATTRAVDLCAWNATFGTAATLLAWASVNFVPANINQWVANITNTAFSQYMGIRNPISTSGYQGADNAPSGPGVALPVMGTIVANQNYWFGISVNGSVAVQTNQENAIDGRAGAMPQGDTMIAFGSLSNTSAQHINGFIGKVKYWNWALSASEMRRAMT